VKLCCQQAKSSTVTHDQKLTSRIEMDGTLGVTPNDPSIWTCSCTSQHPDQDALLTLCSGDGVQLSRNGALLYKSLQKTSEYLFF